MNYYWRDITDTERARLLHERKARKVPWHAPPHFDYVGEVRFLVTAACYEHRAVIGESPGRMEECENQLIELCDELGAELFAWCVLPNHYHLLIQTDQIKAFQKDGLGKFHGRSSYRWNREDGAAGRKVWYRSFERPIDSNGHFWASVNYVNNNAVKHGYASRWQDWPYSSANDYLEKVGIARARAIWFEYPIVEYGRGWDFD